MHFVLLDAAGARCGVASLAPIDWERHEARVVLHAAPGAPLADALALLARYAVEELNLDAFTAEAGGPEAARLLAETGWESDGARRYRRALRDRRATSP